ncbi:ATP-binding protein [Pseudomonas sp. PB101]|uniref:ATP-binding protein n=1 Tax=Pseudomonas sp. PB101 TaxID=2495428 RepID=UPI001365A489|nr:ATP-binding protein [Pseudomonas sp. PB101]MVW85775.1 ATP-binding protein [Pseudomonas sp. PB101]
MNRDEMDAHPVFRKDFTIVTNAVSEASNIALEAIFMRQTGIIFYGLSRVGKTCCIKSIHAQTSGFMPRAYVTQIEVIKQEGSYTNNIVEQLAKEEELVFRRSTLAVEKLGQMADMIINRCHEKNCNHWVLLLDEFQRLRVHDINILFHLFNRLDRKGVTMTVLSFAMPQVFKQRDKLMEVVGGDNEQLIARFMSKLVEFKGCRSAHDLAVILKTFDEKSEYPVGSCEPYTQNFAPAAFKAGFRLADYVQSLWQAFDAGAVGAYKNNVPLEHVFLSIRYLLRYIASHDGSKLEITSVLCADVVERSSLKEFCLLNGSKKQ